MSDRDELTALIQKHLDAYATGAYSDTEDPAYAVGAGAVVADRILARWRLVPKDPVVWAECPRCGASVGAVCQERGGLVAPHKERPRIE